MADEQIQRASGQHGAETKSRETTVGPIDVSVTITVRSPDPGGPPQDDEPKAGLRPRKGRDPV